MDAQPVIIEGVEWANPSTAQRLIAALDRSHYPAGDPDTRTYVINHEITPLANALKGVDLTDRDINFVAWVAMSDGVDDLVSLIDTIRAREVS